jgi:hypothetical protein
MTNSIPDGEQQLNKIELVQEVAEENCKNGVYFPPQGVDEEVYSAAWTRAENEGKYETNIAEGDEFKPRV